MEIMNEQLINLHLEAQNKQDVIKQLGKLLDAANRLNDYDSYITNVLEREQITTTGIGFGIAIPHGKTDAVKKSFCSLRSSKQSNQLEFTGWSKSRLGFPTSSTRMQ